MPDCPSAWTLSSFFLGSDTSCQAVSVHDGDQRLAQQLKIVGAMQFTAISGNVANDGGGWRHRLGTFLKNAMQASHC